MLPLEIFVGNGWDLKAKAIVKDSSGEIVREYPRISMATVISVAVNYHRIRNPKDKTPFGLVSYLKPRNHLFEEPRRPS